MISIPTTLLPHGHSLPHFATTGSAGCDLRAAIPEDRPLKLAPGQRALVPTGLIMEIPEGRVGLICSRSGLALKQGLCVLNAPGIIDSDYRGEIGVVLINHGEEIADIHRGDRVAQFLCMDCPQITFQGQEDLPETTATSERGAGGFGSTGRT